MAEQYLALVEEAARGTDPGSGYLFLPISGTLQPKFTPTDEPRQEFRGNSTELGALTVTRRESLWTYELECSWYPDSQAIGILFKHLLGVADERATVDTSAKRGIIYPIGNGYAGGAPQEGKGIGIVPNTDEGGTTKSQYFGGGRVTKCVIKMEGTADIKLTFTLQGPGEYVGAADQTAISNPTFGSVAPFVSSDALCYIGSGISRTGTKPEFTAIAAGTMNAFRPDSIEINITNGLSDKVIMNGVLGPSWTTRESQFAVEISAPMDYDDPASGFSSADEYKTMFSGVRTNSLLFVLDNGVVAGSTTAKYSAVIDVPNVMVSAEPPERNTEGKTPSIAFNLKSLYSTTTDYPIAVLTTDQNATY
jgi:hypothetical protein